MVELGKYGGTTGSNQLKEILSLSNLYKYIVVRATLKVKGDKMFYCKFCNEEFEDNLKKRLPPKNL